MVVTVVAMAVVVVVITITVAVVETTQTEGMPGKLFEDGNFAFNEANSIRDKLA